MTEITHITIDTPDLDGQRLDKVLSNLVEHISRTRLKQLIEEGHVALNGQTITEPKHKVRLEDKITIRIPESTDAIPQAQDMELDIVYEDKDLLVLNKPVGLVVHPGAGNPDHTLVNALLAHCPQDLSGIGGVKRPGIVHRLDKDTSGLMIVAKNDFAHQHLSAQFAERHLSRTYLAFVVGCLNPRKGEIHGNIGRSTHNRQKMAVHKVGGRTATTLYETKEVYVYKDRIVASLVQCKLLTGRTHQIRVHLNHKGHSILGDKTYGTTPEKLNRLLQEYDVTLTHQALHAAELTFVHPRTEKTMSFKVGLPGDLMQLQDALMMLGEKV
jgi:23S rRNA pseudouridine1911/1915/1917 synthase